MPLDKVVELLKIERECVLRQNGNGCQREKTNCCVGCDLVQSDDDIVKMYDTAITVISNYASAIDDMHEWSKCLMENASEVSN